VAPIAQRALQVAVAAGFGLLGACAHAPAAPQGTLVQCRGGAAEVRIIGSFNAWRDAVPLARGPEGRFIGQLALPPGRILVACQRQNADGTTSTEPPINAPGVEDDGFGGRNGVFEVEGPAGKTLGPRPGSRNLSPAASSQD
jgi:hypothetical protein